MIERITITPREWICGCSPIGDARSYFDLPRDECEDCREPMGYERRRKCKRCGRMVCHACRKVHGIKPPRGGKPRMAFNY